MTTFAVTRVAGPAWTDGKGAFEQPGVEEHAAFMAGLADAGSVLLAGPVAGSETGRIRVLLIAEADTEADVRDRLSADPWEVSRTVVTSSVEAWSLLVGAALLPVPNRT